MTRSGCGVPGGNSIFHDCVEDFSPAVRGAIDGRFALYYRFNTVIALALADLYATANLSSRRHSDLSADR
jgi:hypothetical protein